MIGSGDPLYDSLLESIELESAMYEDDGDGVLSADERTTGGTGGRPI